MKHVSPWVRKYSSLFPKEHPILDVACGNGRHSFFMHELGHDVFATDRDVAAINATQIPVDISIIEADLERQPWPFSTQIFSGVIVVNYLWRPLFQDIIDCLAPGGVLLYDTFAQGNEKYGRPRNPDFLLAPEELNNLCRQNFDILEYFHGAIKGPKPAMRQSIAAIKKP
ncbi:class I SAM-dependent methyltransferase [Sneathiella marina]|uniref:Class I SAM-dependent methyltransferase n=1 Tax=Sneathiella marina TaxID=2950108 RepID=A0ABY4W173_9PROT|nr:class I SAM-dependent methyltransferase [Sneathiella marina]USG60712.1 class I SAM-dependent methyltransferase [Sneathiella marina]